MFRPRRCDECRRRKKRCVIPDNATQCTYCSKKGVPCVLKDEGLQIVHYNPDCDTFGQEGESSFMSRRQSEGSIGSIFVDGANIAKPPKSSSRRGSSNSQNHPLESTNVTTRSLISVINKMKTDAKQQNCKQDSLGFTNMAKVFLPKRDIAGSQGIGDPVFNEELIRSSVPETLKIPEKLPLVDFLLSSIRIHSLDGLSEDPAKLLSLALGEIKSFLDTDKKNGGVVDVLRERGYLVNTRGQASTEQADDPEVHLKKERRLSHAVSESGVPNSIDAIDLTVNTDQLSDEYFIEQAGITLEDGKRKFCEVVGDDAFNDVITSVLFDHFCGITPLDPHIVEQGTPDEKMTTPPESHKLDPLVNNAPKTYLAVVLPLIAGNATVLKAAILLGYHYWVKDDPDDVMSVLHDDMERLHLEVMCELKERLFNMTSLCCDHTILCVFLLLDLELLKGMRGPSWSKLLVLLHTLIKCRGGIKELASTLTGLCLMRLMSGHLCVGMLSFKPESLETHEVINLNDFTYLLDLKPQYQFYDMLNFRPDLCPSDIKELLKIYANVFQLHNLSDISYFANTKDIPEFGDYESMSTQNLEYAVEQSEKLARSITKTLSDINLDHLPEKYKVQYSFALRASLLSLYQLVFRFNSLTPKTVLAVKTLMSDAEVVFEMFSQLTEEEAHDSIVFILPLISLGVDIVSARRRAWYMDNLEMLYLKTRKEPLRNVIDLLNDVWVMNVTGVAYVDGKALADEKGIMLPFSA